MATLVTLRLYRLEFMNGSTQDVVADTLNSVAAQFETPSNPVMKLFMCNQAIQTVETDVPNPVVFSVLITPNTTYGVATPSTFTVEAGSQVIFQAIPNTGHTFTGWFLNGVLLSSNLTAQLTIPAPQISGQSIQIEARFA